MPQVIDLRQGLSREQALDKSLGDLSRAFMDYGREMSRKEAMEMQRQKEKEAGNLRNMQLAIDLSKQSGQTVTPEQAQMIVSGEGAMSDVDGMGPTTQPLRQGLFSNIAQRAQEERDYEKQQRDLGTQVKKAQIQALTKKAKQEQKGPEPKPEQFKAAGFAKRARIATEELGKLPEDVGTGFMSGVQGSQFFPDIIKSDEQKLFEQSKNNFISAVLRKESGAAISDEEYAREEAKYFPQPGDPKSVLAQKARAREQAILNLEAEGAPAMGRIAMAPSASLGQGARGNYVMDMLGPQQAMANEQAHPQANEAMQWAMQNPNDPRAQQIMQRLGVK